VRKCPKEEPKESKVCQSKLKNTRVQQSSPCLRLCVEYWTIFTIHQRGVGKRVNVGVLGGLGLGATYGGKSDLRKVKNM